MTNKLRQLSLLALSFGLVSSYSISSAVPQLREFFSDRPVDQIDLLISIPSFAIMLVMIINALAPHLLKERFAIISGLILFTITGMLPLFIRTYPVLLATRFLFGIGNGMVNTHAVSIISKLRLPIPKMGFAP